LPLNKNAGFWGWQRGVSLHSMKTTSDIVGLFVAYSCTHKSPIWIHLRTIAEG
jgi:uncharacterized membrane protein required for colicin V production